MINFAVLHNKKRSVIALAHALIFMAVAFRGVIQSPRIALLSVSGLVLLSIYAIVTAILVKLVAVARCRKERLYFAFCAASAASGLIGILCGEPILHAVQYVRVLMLACAIVTGLAIFRFHAGTEVPI